MSSLIIIAQFLENLLSNELWSGCTLELVKCGVLAECFKPKNGSFFQLRQPYLLTPSSDDQHYANKKQAEAAGYQQADWDPGNIINIVVSNRMVDIIGGGKFENVVILDNIGLADIFNDLGQE
jgi:hypothetical protein